MFLHSQGGAYVTKHMVDWILQEGVAIQIVLKLWFNKLEPSWGKAMKKGGAKALV